MDRQQIQVSDEECQVPREESRRRRRKKAITSSCSTSMDQISVEFVLPTAARGGSGPDTLQLDVAGNWTVEQVQLVHSFSSQTRVPSAVDVKDPHCASFAGESPGMDEGSDFEPVP